MQAQAAIEQQKPETREPVMVYLKPSVLERVERLREEAGQSRSVWIERAIVKALGDGT